ncbi:MAG TPA: MBL fold metallo-hydrolase [Alphaproteobacteria bacterium]|jgi:phosphoribosyl 1,2-cyclic phosphate phosphodiesterase
MRVTILGSGGAGGVPLIGGDWGLCDPREPKNRRRRVSLLVEDGPAANPTRLMVDTSPDLRDQVLDAGVDRLDAVIYTHHHADHMHGLDDLRQFNRRQHAAIPAYGMAKTLDVALKRFGYVFEPPPVVDGKTIFFKPCLDAHEVSAGRPFEVAGPGGPIKVQPFEQDHGFMPTLGLRFGDVAYSTDVVDMPEAGFETLAGVGLWIVDCFGRKPHPTHVHLPKVLKWIERVQPDCAILTHMGTDMDYGALLRELPEGVVPAYDGMTIEVAPDSLKLVR